MVPLAPIIRLKFDMPMISPVPLPREAKAVARLAIGRFPDVPLDKRLPPVANAFLMKEIVSLIGTCSMVFGVPTLAPSMSHIM